MPRVFAFSDWRVQPIESIFSALNNLDHPVDLIVYSGDDISRFETGNVNWFVELASKIKTGNLLAVIGNDDLPSNKSVFNSPNVHDLHEEPFVYGDYVFLGLEGSLAGDPGYVCYTEEEIKDHLEKQYSEFKNFKPIIVSHVPPYGILDIGRRFGQKHIGSKSLKDFSERIKPSLVICGHCHSFGGRAYEMDFGTIVNVASHDDRKAEGRYAVINLFEGSLSYSFHSTNLKADSPLLKLKQVGQKRIQSFWNAGITDLSQINERNRNILINLPGSSNWHADLWIKQAKAITKGVLSFCNKGDLKFLKNDDLLLLDIETDLNQDRVWLIGLYNYKDNNFTQIFEKDNEKKLLKSFIRYMQDIGYPLIVYYGGNNFDMYCLKNAMRRHSLQKGAELMEKSHDLGITLQTCVLGDFSGYRLEEMAHSISGYKYTTKHLSGFDVGEKYTRYMLDGEDPNWEQLKAYNKDDVMALKSIVDKIRELL